MSTILPAVKEAGPSDASLLGPHAESTPLLAAEKSPQATGLDHPGEPPLMSMFEKKRWRSDMPWWSYLLLALWTPFGVILCAIRFVLFFLGYCSRIFLYPCGIDRYMYRITYTLCGMVVKTDRKVLQAHDRPRIFVCNHVSDFDGFILYDTVPAQELTFITTVYLKRMVRFSQRMGIPVTVIYRASGNDPAKKKEVRDSVVAELQKGRRVLFVLAEGAETNGRVGLLRYQKFVFGLGMDILPIALRLQPPKWWPGNPEYSGDSFIKNISYMFFTPYHVYHYKPLAVQAIQEGENDSQFADRVQGVVAKELGLVPTTYGYGDKVAAFKLRR